jgi:hypothetical protein
MYEIPVPPVIPLPEWFREMYKSELKAVVKLENDYAKAHLLPEGKAVEIQMGVKSET